ncbi:hypothetical protein KY363_06480 [Candidatus Woesearchaeota archaeon]|nr:hypothetical protein [Candidatus Woesearchaeota archaeon]
MMKCKKCGNAKIRTRKNYSHGKRSKAIVSLTCMACGSADIEKPQEQGFRRRRR